MQTCAYFDTAALVKLVVWEPESAGLRAWIREQDGATLTVTCDLSRTELLRTIARKDPEAMADARHLIRSLTIGEVSQDTFAAASRLGPPELRSLDAIHLASALELGDALDAFVTYDKRLAEAATMLGLPVVAPS
ncbi:type II toxin-antitoxin system VapC family toxin [Antribacter sp. KLBMP9083]|uniref:Ribonuclease VapC n=1 Tax=Antribacter soli TaxID=2910976 RepID=A0AA41U9T1_9MICO|nr:type II toxin-antitoxin system VapC family toxin [Antribacter soli]MCF4121937.1 type II toxin-antitoxin system VapC family toxin [Antribacter soli]